MNRQISTVWLNENTLINRFGLGSCFVPQFEIAEEFKGQISIWEHVSQANPQLFIMMGDNVYQENETNEIIINNETIEKARLSVERMAKVGR